MIGYYNYTVVLTYLGTLSGFAGMICIGNGNLKAALICLMISGFCDMFDGKIASTMKRTKQEKRFGIQIDALSDLICFGVLPAMIGFFCGGKTILQAAASSVYLLCALIRLAWFNVSEEERQDQEDRCRESYLGLPVTASALLLPFFMALAQRINLPADQICPWLLLAVAAAFISPIHLKKPKMIGKLGVILCGMADFVLVLIG